MGRSFTTDRHNKITGQFVPHRACVEAIKLEQAELINFFQKERSAVAAKKSEIRDMDQAFRARSTRFRAVFDAAWNILMIAKQVKCEHCNSANISFDLNKAAKQLHTALDRADHLWEGYGGVIPDPDPRAERWKSNKISEHGNKTRVRNHSRFPNFTDPHE